MFRLCVAEGKATAMIFAESQEFAVFVVSWVEYNKAIETEMFFDKDEALARFRSIPTPEMVDFAGKNLHQFGLTGEIGWGGVGERRR